MLPSMSMNFLMVATSSYLTTEMLLVMLSSNSGCLANITGQLTRQHPLQLAPSRGSWMVYIVYKPPLVLRKRKDITEGGVAMEADDAITGVELHKESMFSQSWQTFKDSNSGKQVSGL